MTALSRRVRREIQAPIGPCPPTCSFPGCDQPMLVAVGIVAEPLCEEHFKAWLKEHRKAAESLRKLLPELAGRAKARLARRTP